MSALPLAAPASGPGGLDLDALTDQDLDLLPYGVIALDPQGMIVRYNRVEARLARLDRALVMGKDFFRTVAPCTATPEFQGRFQAFLEDPHGPTRVRFEYVFNFRFGAQEVDIDLVRSSFPDRVYVCVGRRTFRRAPLRDSGIPGAALDGVALSELAPDESKKGVVRDALERRNLVLDASFLDVLAATFQREARGTLEDLGVAYGRRLALDLEAEAGEAFDAALADIPIVTLMELVTNLFARQGWGALAVDLRPARSGLMTFTLERSAFAEAPGTLGGKRCGLIAGILRALFSHVATKPLVVQEAKCSAEGAATCTFIATGARREGQLDAATRASPPPSLDDVLRAMGRRA